jgi:hypothetical protein
MSTVVRTCLNCRREVVLRWDAQRACYRVICRCGAHCSTTHWFDSKKKADE